PLAERCHARLSLRVLLRQIHEYGDPAEAIAWLRSCRRKRPSGRAAKQGDELAPPYHSITSSARASSVSGRVRPSALAVVRLMVRSNFVGCSTGMSAGLAPRRTLSVNSAARRNVSG